MAQWLRIDLAVQGPWVRYLVRELRFHTLWGKEAHVLQLLKPTHSSPCSATRKASLRCSQGPTQPNK